MPPRRRYGLVAAVFAVAALLLAGCGSESSDHEQPHRTLTQPAEPGTAPPQHAEPAGTVVDLPGGGPWGIAVDDATGTVAVALRGPGRLALVDIGTHEVRTVRTPGAARMLDPAGPGRLLFPAENKNALYQIALPSGRVLSTVPVGKQPHEAVTAGNTVFLADEVGGYMGVIRNGKQVRTFEKPVQPGGIATESGRVALVDVRSNTLFVYDIDTMKLVAALPAGKGPSHVRPLGEGMVAVCDVRGKQIITYDVSGKPHRIDSRLVPGRAFGVATQPSQNLVYAALSDTNKVARLQVSPDGSLGKPVTLPTVRQPDSLAVDHATGTIYVAGNKDAALQIIPADAFGR